MADMPSARSRPPHRRTARPRPHRAPGRRRMVPGLALGVLLLVALAGIGSAGVLRADAPAEPAGERPKAYSTALPFDLPPTAELRRSGKLVFAHYFTPYPLSLDNEPAERDYYTRNYLTPHGEKGKHRAYGGLLRDRPLPVAPEAGNWQLAHLRQEIRTARDAGLDGFTLDLLSAGGRNWDRAELLLRAAHEEDPGFRIQLMPDMTALTATTPAELADSLARLARHPAAHRLPDGRLVVSPFKAEEKEPDWWREMMRDLETRHGIRTALVPLFLDFTAERERYAAISHGFSEWGARSPGRQDGAAADAQRAHRLGKIWMQPVSVQDARPNQGVYDEAGNTETLRASWGAALESGADWVQLTTWNDYSEGTHFAPSLHNGYAYLDLTSYYLTRFKTGDWPRIVRDTVYLTSRVQFVDDTPSARLQPQLIEPRSGTATPRDTVEVLSFLTAPAQVRTDTGGTAGGHRAPTGVHAELLPLRPGHSSATVVRDGKTTTTVTSRYPVRRAVDKQDLQYYAVTSGRGQR
ncbi:glycoside hydrolase family 71 protein [Streptomyces vilmorinianum]|uniref:glycoside hydrolase family 71 protein n=1 Tax=Streptomyces vilmorinianum TaxID=3051092 RepID=UPI0020C7A5B8|nr:glycoside hydrolase family 71 protein [Streptomyces vilmorinianum]